MSLGVDPVSLKDKICNMDCLYCQLGRTNIYSNERRHFIPTEDIVREIQSLPRVHVDYVTFSGRGEPTLAENLGEMIRGIRKIRKERIAVITNSTLLGRPDVQKDLSLADFVLAKLDVCSEESLKLINKVTSGIPFESILEGIISFKKNFKGRLAIQIMFINENKGHAREIAQIVRKIKPDEVQINTPLRACPTPHLTRNEINRIKHYFYGLPTVTVYDTAQKTADPFSNIETSKRHGRAP